MRRAFQITLLLVAFIPFLLGAMSLLQGAARLVPENLITTELDGQIRFWGIRSMLPFLLAIWIVAHLERAYTVLVIILLASAAGGVARAFSAMMYGAPQPIMVGVIAFEIAVLLFIPWYRMVVQRRAESPASA